MTKQRQLIYKILVESREHPTAAMVYQEAKKIMPSIATGTVYRNLGLMVDAGEVLKIPIPGEPDRFDGNVKPHGHLVCSRCGRVEDFFVDGIEEKIQEQIGMEVTNYELKVQGLCKACVNGSARSKDQKAKS